MQKFTPSELPMYNRILEFRERLFAALTKVLVVVGATGSGKTTLTPWGLATDPRVKGEILVLVPRRVLAKLAAKFVSEANGTKVGNEVGYIVRFEARPGTLITYMTEGVFLRRILSEPELPGVAAVFFDEAHEESRDSLVSQALTKRLKATSRPELIVVVMSATLDVQRYAGYWNCEVLSVEGRQFPVEVTYHPELGPEQAVLKIMEESPLGVGTILVFETGGREVEFLVASLRDLLEDRAEVLGYYGDMDPDEQELALVPPTGWRVVVATNVFETGVTLPGGPELGVKYVVCLGWAKVSRFDPATRSKKLAPEPCSWASADQRAGRAGCAGAREVFTALVGRRPASPNK